MTRMWIILLLTHDPISNFLP